MPAFRISINAGGALAAAAPDAAIGSAADGATIYEVRNCPEETTLDDAIAALVKLRPAAGTYHIDFPKPQSAPCCGGCGGGR